ncbi:MULTISPECIES: hypothetical protein [Cyanophyceae]|uniref:hypothetical protein n=1 Tax=Cyanophyceae TaxID=3028117 RepID=UPI00168A0225|nr:MULTISPECIES: hypothetical protein [Cyanophyceae]MBD1915462.1 hypothetical protein [Phormidium sp. FACHB-77]MBD2028533.1 hypothetical protein [Phormidium sp. FACHB-322]MBD2051073.1 hypothetical protein [Leptolyngbya sp. FACHB-60]
MLLSSESVITRNLFKINSCRLTKYRVHLTAFLPEVFPFSGKIPSLRNLVLVGWDKHFMMTFLMLSDLKKMAVKLLAAAMLAAVLEAFSIGQPVRANPDPLTVVVEVYGTPTRGALDRQAESAAVDEITRAFTQNSQLSSVQINVLGQLNGRVAPIFSLSVSREQWLRSRQTALQTAQYYYSSYGLLGLDSDDEGRTSTTLAQASSSPVVSRDPSVQVGEAFRQGRLSPEEYDQLVNALD